MTRRRPCRARCSERRGTGHRHRKRAILNASESEGAINLKQLIYFRKAVETGNLTRAASDLNVAQTALGLQIRNLEEELGVRLLERHSRGVSATDVGRVLLTHAEDILHRIDDAKYAVRSFAASDRRIVRIGLTPSIVRLVGDAILTDLSRQLDCASLLIVEDFSFILMRQMASGEIDCAMTYADDIDPAYHRRALLEEDLLFMTAARPGASTGPIPFREAISGDLALTAKQDVVTRSLHAIAVRLGLKMSVTYEVQSIRAVKNLVAKGVANTVMPYGAAEGELRKGEFIARPIVSPPVGRTLSFVRTSDPVFAGIESQFDAFAATVADRLHAAPGPTRRF